MRGGGFSDARPPRDASPSRPRRPPVGRYVAPSKRLPRGPAAAGRASKASAEPGPGAFGRRGHSARRLVKLVSPRARAGRPVAGHRTRRAPRTELRDRRARGPRPGSRPAADPGKGAPATAQRRRPTAILPLFDHHLLSQAMGLNAAKQRPPVTGRADAAPATAAQPSWPEAARQAVGPAGFVRARPAPLALVADASAPRWVRSRPRAGRFARRGAGRTRRGGRCGSERAEMLSNWLTMMNDSVGVRAESNRCCADSLHSIRTSISGQARRDRQRAGRESASMTRIDATILPPSPSRRLVTGPSFAAAAGQPIMSWRSRVLGHSESRTRAASTPSARKSPDCWPCAVPIGAVQRPHRRRVSQIASNPEIFRQRQRCRLA